MIINNHVCNEDDDSKITATMLLLMVTMVIIIIIKITIVIIIMIIIFILTRIMAKEKLSCWVKSIKSGIGRINGLSCQFYLFQDSDFELNRKLLHFVRLK